MANKVNGSYVGLDLDDLETSESVRTHTSSYSRLSDISLLKYHAQRRTKKAVSGFSSHARRAVSKDFWQQAIPRSKIFFSESFADLKTLGCGHFFWRFFTILVPFVVVSSFVAIIPIITSANLYHVTSPCQPDSGFYVGFGQYNIWDLSGFFQITLGFGQFSFTGAKSLDVGWDIVVGRGGQAILAAVSFAVYTKALVRVMESAPVSYGTFEAITLQHASFTANFKLARDLLKNKTVRARALIVWFILSACFVLAFPTILSAMSGYSANIEAFVEIDNGNMLLYSNFTLVRYVVHDAHRIDEALPKDFQVTTAGNSIGNGQISQLEDYETSDACAATYYPRRDENDTLDWSYAHDNPICAFYWHTSQYIFNYGLLGLNQTNSTFNNSGKLVNLDAPSLNITAIFWKQDWLTGGSSDGTDWWNWPYGYYWKTETGERPFHNFTDPIFTNGQFTYELEALNARGRCQQENTSYQWGFSFLILFWFTVAILIWAFGMAVVWTDAFLFSRFDRAGRQIGLQRAVLDLAYCMHRDVDHEGRDMLSNNELEKKIRKDLNGGRITYEMLDGAVLPPNRATVYRQKWRDTDKKAWLKRKGWPIGLFLASLGFFAASLAGAHTPLFTAFLLVLGFGSVLFIHEKHLSRWLIFLICAVFAIVLAPIGPYVYLDKHHYAIIWLRQDPYYTLSWWYNY